MNVNDANSEQAVAPVETPQGAAVVDTTANADQGGAEPLAEGQPIQEPPAPAYDPLAVVAEFTGGAIRTSQDWETFRAARAEAEELRTKTLGLETKLGQYTPLSSKVNEMLLSGQDLNAVKQFLDVQAINTETLSDLDAIKAKYALDYPQLTADQIEAYLEDAGLISLSEVTSPAMVAKQAIQGREAKAHLASLKVATIAPQANAAAEAQAAQEAQYRQTIERWNAVQKPTLITTDIKSGDYTTQVQLSPDAINSGYEAAMAWVKSTGVGFDTANQKTFEDLQRHFALAHDHERIVQFVATDAYNKGVLSTKQALSGAPPGAVPTGTPPSSTVKTGGVRFSS